VIWALYYGDVRAVLRWVADRLGDSRPIPETNMDREVVINILALCEHPARRGGDDDDRDEQKYWEQRARMLSPFLFRDTDVVLPERSYHGRPFPSGLFWQQGNPRVPAHALDRMYSFLCTMDTNHSGWILENATPVQETPRTWEKFFAAETPQAPKRVARFDHEDLTRYFREHRGYKKWPRHFYSLVHLFWYLEHPTLPRREIWRPHGFHPGDGKRVPAFLLHDQPRRVFGQCFVALDSAEAALICSTPMSNIVPLLGTSSVPGLRSVCCCNSERDDPVRMHADIDLARRTGGIRRLERDEISQAHALLRSSGSVYSTPEPADAVRARSELEHRVGRALRASRSRHGSFGLGAQGHPVVPDRRYLPHAVSCECLECKLFGVPVRTGVMRPEALPPRPPTPSAEVVEDEAPAAYSTVSIDTPDYDAALFVVAHELCRKPMDPRSLVVHTSPEFQDLVNDTLHRCDLALMAGQPVCQHHTAEHVAYMERPIRVPERGYMETIF
jgi:hypothetical protein